ncbi:MAG: type II secretion system F family protein [Pseudomonadota bacterium]|nr:type II secretion system F family protein [Pseudomonadota bacterium]
MALYRYKAANPEGEVLEGELEARDQAAAIERLQSLGYIPIRAEETLAGGARRSGWITLRRSKRLSQAQLVALTQELATLLRARLPLDRALEVLIDLSGQGTAGQLLTRIREGVHGGATLSAAMEAQSGVFSRLYLNMLRAGEAGGALELVLTRLSEYLERARELQESVTSALIYPAILLGVAGLSVLVLLVYVVPQFEQLFSDAGAALPFATQVVISMGNFLRDYWWLLILAAVLIGLYFRKQLAQPATRYRWDQRFLKLPMAGELITKIEVARFSRMLGTLLTNGVPLLSGLSIVKETLGNQVLAEGVGIVAERLKHGHGLAEPLTEIAYFPRLAVHMVRVGEETGQLEEMLMQVAEVYDREVRATVKRMLALLEPVLILGLGLVIAAIIMSILVAILSVNELAF